MELTHKYWYRTKLATAAVLIGAALFVFTLSAGIAPCSTVFAQSTSCSVGDAETFTGPVDFQDEVNLGATPGPGSNGQVFTSSGADTTPEWESVALLKTADEAVDSGGTGSTLQDDDELTFELVANATYMLHGNLRINAHTTPDFKFQWSLPASAIVDGHVTAFDGSADETVLNFNETAATSIAGVSADGSMSMAGVIITAGTAGTAVLQWAQVTPDANDTTVKAGSWISLRRID